MFDEKFWVALSFAIFVAAVYKNVAKLITAKLDERSEKIRKELEEAKLLKEEAIRLLEAYKQKQFKAEHEIKQMLAQTEKEANAMLEQAKIELNNSLNKRKKMALEKIASLEDNIKTEFSNQVIEHAIKTVTFMLSNGIDATTSKHLLEESISSLSKKIH